jgi:hypothetical protein
MKDPKDVLNGYVADMAAVERHILDAVTRQLDGDAMNQYPDARRVTEGLQSTLRRHLDTLERELESKDGSDIIETVKKVVGSALGVIAGIYDKVRTDEVSRMIRDNYTATSLAAISYHMLHTTALGLKDERVADMALNHLRDLTPILVDLSQVVCTVVAAELAHEDKVYDGTVGPKAIENTQEAWSASWVHTGSTM